MGIGEGDKLLERELTERIIGCAIEVHREIGPGLLESVYEEALAIECGLQGLAFQRQLVVPLVYKGSLLTMPHRIDMLVENKVVLELKCVETILPVHEAQLLTNMKLGSWRIGLLINFKTAVLKNGIRRMVL
jgi:GxxExxY protein